jgi:predicted O-methyltransferase YrrM
MIRRSLLPEGVEFYVGQVATKETALQKQLRKVTEKLPNAGMQLGPDQSAFLAWLAELIGARRTLEIGTFTGFSALSVAMALPKGGKLVACDINDEWAAIGKRFWKEAGVEDKIDLRIDPALDTLKKLAREFGKNSFDLAFIDADKTAYDLYYEACLELVRANGVIVLDNMFRNGQVINKRVKDEATQAIRELNLKIRDDERVSAVLLSLGDGMMVVRKR